MPPKRHVKPKPYWSIFLPRRERQATRNVTWGDIKACIAALNANSSEVFAGLHRCEGGFMCVEGPGFKSEDRVDTGLPHQNPTRLCPDQIVHKEIRFEDGDVVKWGRCRIDWPSCCCSFLDNDVLTDDWVAMEEGNVTRLRFNGEHCVPWTREQCEAHARVVEQALGLGPVTSRKRRRAYR
jgi:hypothetical protein